MAKLYKVVSYVVDLENRKPEELLYFIKSGCKYVHPIVEEFEVADIGEWSDDHPANKQGCDYSVFEFKDVDFEE